MNVARRIGGGECVVGRQHGLGVAAGEVHGPGVAGGEVAVRIVACALSLVPWHAGVVGRLKRRSSWPPRAFRAMGIARW